MINDDVHEIIHNVWHDNATEAFLTTIINSVQLPDRCKVVSALQNSINSLSIVCLNTRGCGHTLHPQFNIFAKGSIIGDDKTWTQVHVANQRFSAVTAQRAILPVDACEGGLSKFYLY